MNELAELEEQWMERERTGSWEDVFPPTMLALVRVARAALAFTDSPDNVAGWTPHTEAYAALVASVEAFRS